MEKKKSPLSSLEQIRSNFWNEWTFVSKEDASKIPRSIQIEFFEESGGYFIMSVSLEIGCDRHYHRMTLARDGFCSSRFKFLVKSMADDISMKILSKRFNIFRHMVKKKYIC